MVSLSLSWAEAGEVAESSVAAASTTASWCMRIITVSLKLVAQQSPARLSRSSPRTRDPDTYCRTDVHLLSLFLLRPAQHRRCRDRRITRLDPHIDHDHMALVDRGDRLLERRNQLARLGHRSEALRALRAGKRRDIDIGLGDALADPAVLDRTRADAGDALLMQLFIEERAIIGDHDQERDLVMHRGPDRGVRHHEVAVAAHTDDEPAEALERERGADRVARAAADATAAFRAHIVERMPERPGGAVP